MAVACPAGTHAQRSRIAVSDGYVRINGAPIGAPSRVVRTGDVITVALDRSVRVVKVRGFADLEVARCIAEEAKLSGDEAAIGLELALRLP